MNSCLLVKCAQHGKGKRILYDSALMVKESYQDSLPFLNAAHTKGQEGQPQPWPGTDIKDLCLGAKVSG